jgi:hypothetical protein
VETCGCSRAAGEKQVPLRLRRLGMTSSLYGANS